MFIFVVLLCFNFSLFQAQPVQYHERNQQNPEESVPVIKKHTIIPFDDQIKYTGQRFDITPTESETSVISINNGNNKVNTINIDDTIRGYSGFENYPQTVPDTIYNKRLNSFYPIRYDNRERAFYDQNTRRTVRNNIGNGYNNNNVVIIGGPTERGNIFTDLFSFDKHTQQTEKNWPQYNNAQEVTTNHNIYNDPPSRSNVAIIGHGKHNNNVIIVNGQVIRSDSDTILINGQPENARQGYSDIYINNNGQENNLKVLPLKKPRPQ